MWSDVTDSYHPDACAVPVGYSQLDIASVPDKVMGNILDGHILCFYLIYMLQHNITSYR